MSQDISQGLQQQVQEAISNNTALNIVAGKSKQFLGRTPQGEILDVSGHTGIVNYAPVELVVTVRAGTTVKELSRVLAENGQMLAFDPPAYAGIATIGGTVAAALSGPGRPYLGSVRDYVLGVKMINGYGEIVRFGGEVMKNVAGYDLSRLMVGAMGTLGVLLEVSLKVMPMHNRELTTTKYVPEAEALELMSRWATQSLPLTASFYSGDRLYFRLSGASKAVEAAFAKIGGELLSEGHEHWVALREQQTHFFDTENRAGKRMWRLSVPPTSLPLALTGKTVIDWGGAQRWLISEAEPEQVFQACTAVGGHATLFRGSDNDRVADVYQPLAQNLLALHKNVKKACDPHGIFNPGRLYASL